MNWYLGVLKKYAEFGGRAHRTEYWMFVLFNLIFTVAACIVDRILGLHYVMYGLYALAILIPGIAVTVRRLHDTDRSGWWLLIVLVPLIGAIVLLVFYVQDSQPGDNQFGPNPKGAPAPA